MHGQPGSLERRRPRRLYGVADVVVGVPSNRIGAMDVEVLSDEGLQRQATGDNAFAAFSTATYATFIVMFASHSMTISILGRGLMFRAIGQKPNLSAGGLYP